MMQHFFTFLKIGLASLFLSLLAINSINAQTDLALTSIDTMMTSGCGGLTPQIVRVYFSNVGTTVINSPSVSYRVNGGAAVNGTIAGAIPVGGTGSFNFPFAYVFPSTGTFVFEAWVRATGDNNTLNDTAFRTVINLSSKTGGDTLNFDVNSSLTSGGTNNSWAHGAPVKGLITTAPSSPNIWVTNLSLFYNTNEDSWIQTGCYDLSGLTQPMVRFDLNYRTETNYDGAILEASIDGGSTWSTVGAQGSGSNWYNGILNRSYYTGPIWMNYSNGWIRAEHNLSDLSSLTQVIFRFHFYSDGSVEYDGIGIDNFEIYDSNSYFPEISVNQITFKKPNSCGLLVDTMIVTIRNNSNSVISNLPIQININGVSDSLVLSNTILPFDSLNYLYPLSSKLVLGRNDILVFSSLSGDIDKTNDTLSINRSITYNDTFSLNLPDTIKSTNTTLTLNPGSANSFLWSTGETTSTINVNKLGKYTVIAKNSAGCFSTDTTMVLFFRTSPRSTSTLLGLINYQATLAHPTGNPISNQTIKIRFSIQDSLNTNYSEWQSIQTDSRGNIAVQVGNGNKILGSLEGIEWWDGQNRTLKTEIDTSGTGNWIVLGNSQLVSVPSALYALKSGDGSSSIYGSIDPNGNILTGNGFSVTPLGNGSYEIDFQQPFNEVPIFWINSVGSGYYSENIISVSPSKISFQVTGSPNRIQFEANGK